MTTLAELLDNAPAEPDEPEASDKQAPASDGGRHRPKITPFRVVAALLLGVFVLTCLIFSAFGWRVHSMLTPSMGRTAPVGSAVITSPVSINDVHVGEIISFQPPGRSTVFVHRVYSISHANGVTSLRTKGDIDGAVDGWVLTAKNLTGHERVIVPDLAFLLQVLPVLLIGSMLILIGTSTMRMARRGPIRLGLFALLGSYIIWHYRFLTRIVLITQTISNGRGQATVVPTGILPLRVTAAGGSHADLTPGQVGMVTREHLPVSGHFSIHAANHLTGWWWLLLLVWLIPVAVSLRFSRTQASAAVVIADDTRPAVGKHVQRTQSVATGGTP